MDFKVTVTHSLISTHSIRGLLDSYEITDVISCDFLTRGLNDSYVITTDSEKYIFRVYRHNWRTESDILFEIDALHYLKMAGFPVSSPINTVEGNWIIAIQAPEGMRYGVLFTYSSGERPVINQENCSTLGRSLGELHKHTTAFHPAHRRNFNLDMQHLIDEPLSYLLPVLEKVLHRGNPLKDIEENIKREILSSKLEYGFCHGDFHNFNMHIDDQNLEVFDFDCCSIGYRTYDIAVFWWNLKNNYPTLEKACWDEFLNGYLSQRNVPEADLKSLPLFISVRRIWLLGTMLKNEDVWGTNWINETNLNQFLLDLEKDQQLF